MFEYMLRDKFWMMMYVLFDLFWMFGKFCL